MRHIAIALMMITAGFTQGASLDFAGPPPQGLSYGGDSIMEMFESPEMRYETAMLIDDYLDGRYSGGDEVFVKVRASLGENPSVMVGARIFAFLRASITRADLTEDETDAGGSEGRGFWGGLAYHANPKNHPNWWLAGIGAVGGAVIDHNEDKHESKGGSSENDRAVKSGSGTPVTQLNILGDGNRVDYNGKEPDATFITGNNNVVDIQVDEFESEKE